MSPDQTIIIWEFLLWGTFKISNSPFRSHAQPGETMQNQAEAIGQDVNIPYRQARPPFQLALPRMSIPDRPSSTGLEKDVRESVGVIGLPVERLGVSHATVGSGLGAVDAPGILSPALDSEWTSGVWFLRVMPCPRYEDYQDGPYQRSKCPPLLPATDAYGTEPQSYSKRVCVSKLTSEPWD
ncbi:hypothetical protein BO71DRAFT_485406 [Aspergillus ellipticus CBS 707.79]|uniref:Uncharacterized protein n=1 Tax=Aspergillus ellipticus CBS 707.79 TaxID=1448320 RepID=A0A319DDU4_9EURO|nr:hypothetical protein BO71DRAFT_485406 [Aspergillus ellipticus CBS 707.79]